jgi:hypothetical protein
MRVPLPPMAFIISMVCGVTHDTSEFSDPSNLQGLMGFLLYMLRAVHPSQANQTGRTGGDLVQKNFFIKDEIKPPRMLGLIANKNS